ncbi:MAG: TonB-dependent receptor plug domain-containing protein [Terriglobales bacterium]
MNKVFCPIRRPIAVIVLVVLMGLVNEALGDSQPEQKNGEPLKQLSLAQLGDVEVTTVSKEPEEVWKIPAAIFVLTNEDIRRSGATSIPEVLRLVPGVQVSRIDNDHWAVGIRGFADQFSKSMLVMVDGRSLYTPLFAGVYWALQDGILLEDVERIEVIRGPGGTIWGANAVTGVINIITKSAKETHGALVSAGGGNIDQGIGGFRYGAGNGSNLDYRMYGKGFSRGAGFHSDEQGFDTWRMGQLGFRTDWDVRSNDHLTIQGDMYKGGVGEAVGFGSFTPPEQIISDQAVAVSGGNLLARWRHDLREGSDIQIQAYYDRTYALAPHYEETRNTFDVDFIHHLVLGARQNFIWGLGARFSPSEFVKTIPTLDFIPHDIANNVYSGFVQDEIAIVPNKFSLMVGSKLEHNNYTGFEFQPSIRGLWSITPRQTFWAAVTRAVRTPSRIEEDFHLTDFGIANPLIYVAIEGNHQLTSERLIGYEAGYRTLVTPKFYVDIAVFHNDYNDLISLGAPGLTVDPTPTPLHFTIRLPYVNGLRGSTDGFEVAPDWRPAPWWQMKATYSYLNLNLESKPGVPDGGGYVTQDEGSSPHNQVTFRSRFNLPKGFEFDQTYRYMSALPAQLVKSYSTADVHFAWRATRQFELSVAGENLFQPHHPEFGHDISPLVGIKRSVYAQITWRHPED